MTMRRLVSLTNSCSTATMDQQYFVPHQVLVIRLAKPHRLLSVPCADQIQWPDQMFMAQAARTAALADDGVRMALL